MSRVLEDRVLAAHPLAPAHRMILFIVARAVEDGQTEAVVNRSALARELDARPAIIGDALMAGEQLGLCRVLRNGRILFTDGGLFAEAPPATPAPTQAIRPTPTNGELPVSGCTVADVLGEFARQRQAVYHQRYIFTQGKDHKLAKSLTSLSQPEVARAVHTFLTHPNPYYADCRHAFSVFVQDINRFTAPPPPAAPSSESRVPDADSTRRYIQELNRDRSARRPEGFPRGGTPASAQSGRGTGGPRRDHDQP